MSTDKKPASSAKTLWGMLSGAFWGWVTFNIIFVIAGALLIRLVPINTWPYQIAIANYLTGNRFINPETLVTGNTNLRYLDTVLIDVDGDGEQERVLFYRYDLVAGRSPIGATVLDVNQCRPRGIDSYDLIPVDRDYLSDAGFYIEVRDIANVGEKRIVVWGLEGGLRTEAAIFAWYDQSQPCQAPAPGVKGYLNLGSFRGSGGVQITGDGSVRVKQRAFERSQLAVVSVYRPADGSYRQGINGPMRPPAAKAVEFTFTPPTPVPQTYYPEKAVLAFYLAIGVNTAEAKTYLHPDVVDVFTRNGNGWNVAEPEQLTTMAEVKELAYTPDVQKEQEHAEVAVEVEVVNRRPDGSLHGPQRVRVFVRGVPKAGAFPYDCEWRIVGFEFIP
jgi:hypothetical protein